MENLFWIYEGNWYRKLCGHTSSNHVEFHAILLDISSMQQWQWGVNRVRPNCKCIFSLFMVLDAKKLAESNDSYFGLLEYNHWHCQLRWISMRSWNFQQGIHEMFVSLQMKMISSWFRRWSREASHTILHFSNSKIKPALERHETLEKFDHEQINVQCCYVKNNFVASEVLVIWLQTINNL